MINLINVTIIIQAKIMFRFVRTLAGASQSRTFTAKFATNAAHKTRRHSSAIFASLTGPASNHTCALFQYIGKNKILPAQLAAIKPNCSTVEKLFSAIQKGDAKADVFSHPDCDISLLHLMNTNRIPFWQGITVYGYLLALMQFTDKQAIAEKDQDVKRLRPVEVETIESNKKLSASGIIFFRQIRQYFENMHHDIDEDEFKEYIFALPPSERWLLNISNPLKNLNLTALQRYRSDDITTMTGACITNLGFIGFPYCTINSNLFNKTSFYQVPSVSVMNYLFRKLSPNPMEMLPMFGSINNVNLHKLHKDNKHPVSLYNKRVKSNPFHADGYRCGPFLVWLHDILHIFGANLLTYEERTVVLTQIVPALEKMQLKARQIGRYDEVESLQGHIDSAIDFDLTPFSNFTDPASRLENYVKRICSDNENSPLFHTLMQIVHHAKENAPTLRR